MKLYSYFRSSAAYRVRIALNLKHLDASIVPVHLVKKMHQADDYAALNPQKLVPALSLDSGDVITQSLAIMEYLEECDDEPVLLPTDIIGRARVRALSQLIASDIHPLNNLRVLAYLKNQLQISETQKNAWYQHWIHEGFGALEQRLQEAATGKFCHGDTPTMADCCLVPQVFNAKRFDVDLGAYPTIQAIYANCMALEAFVKASPSEQIDAE